LIRSANWRLLVVVLELRLHVELGPDLFHSRGGLRAGER
jgi:hypothetical protein